MDARVSRLVKTALLVTCAAAIGAVQSLGAHDRLLEDAVAVRAGLMPTGFKATTSGE